MNLSSPWKSVKLLLVLGYNKSLVSLRKRAIKAKFVCISLPFYKLYYKYIF